MLTLTVGCHDGDDLSALDFNVDALEDPLPPIPAGLDVVADVSELEMWVLEHPGVCCTTAALERVHLVHAEAVVISLGMMQGFFVDVEVSVVVVVEPGEDGV